MLQQLNYGHRIQIVEMASVNVPYRIAIQWACEIVYVLEPLLAKKFIAETILQCKEEKYRQQKQKRPFYTKRV